MRLSCLALALALLARACGSPAPAALPARSVSARGWQRLLAEYARSETSRSDEGEWFPRPLPLELPLGEGGASVPLLVIPVPVPARDAQCGAAGARADHPPPPPPPAGVLLDPSAPRPPASLSHYNDEAFAPRPSATPSPYDEESPTVTLEGIESSQQLVELFRAQTAAHPELPPAVLPDYARAEDGAAAEETPPPARLVRLRRRPLAALAPRATRAASSPAPAGPAVPLTPVFDRSLLLRGVLTVPRAGYSEPYTVWWDAASGDARIDYHGGAASTYRRLTPDGRVQLLAVQTDRSGERVVRRCAASEPRRAAAADRAFPLFPELRGFSFAGYADSEFGAVERWTQTLGGGGGALGGARGEALVFRHELLLARAPDNHTTTPLRYSVRVDSSVLGAASDAYVHRYTELRDALHDPRVLRLDPEEACDALERTEARHRLEPLREFLLPARDPRYDALLQQFKATHRRRYRDDAEEALRKNLMMQHTRFIGSGNRQGGTFSLEMNFLADRLDAELRSLGGVREEPEREASELFPHSHDDVSAAAAQLPRRFDWRRRGAVTHVRNQGASCQSCWAEAVTGAVEGALFVATRRLVPLSEQCLVDCAGPFGGHGCGGTWPSSAYEYVRARGLPALHEYTPYHAAAGECRDDAVPPVTHISGHVNVTARDVLALKVAIKEHSPTVVIVDWMPKSFLFYKSGVLYDERCEKDAPRHAVLAVGWGEQRGEAHFILKNSWTAKWGDGGYVRLQAPANTCGVLSRPSYPRLEPPDVRRVPTVPAAPPARR